MEFLPWFTGQPVFVESKYYPHTLNEFRTVLQEKTSSYSNRLADAKFSTESTSVGCAALPVDSRIRSVQPAGGSPHGGFILAV